MYTEKRSIQYKIKPRNIVFGNSREVSEKDQEEEEEKHPFSDDEESTALLQKDTGI